MQLYTVDIVFPDYYYRLLVTTSAGLDPLVPPNLGSGSEYADLGAIYQLPVNLVP